MTLPSTTAIPSSPVLRRFLTRLPKQTLIDLVLIWLDHPLTPLPPPDDEDEFLDGPDSLDDRKAVYGEYAHDSNVTKRVVIDRILGTDWRLGLNVLQVAMLDMQHVFHNPTACKWIASELQFATQVKSAVQTRPMPSLRPTSLVNQLRRSLNPLMRNHIYIQSHPTLPLLLLRLLLNDTAAKTDLLSPRRTFLLAIPSSSPYIFHTPSTDTLQDLIRQSLSQVFSTPRFPVVVQPVVPGLSAKNLASMMALCGASRDAGALGAWRVYARGWVDGSPLAPEKVKMEIAVVEGERGKRESVARARFGLRPRTRNLLDASVEEEEEEVVLPALERAEWKITHGYPDDVSFTPVVTMRLDGSNVFHGVYEGVCEGWIDGARLPGWLTGEEGRTEGQIHDGRVS